MYLFLKKIKRWLCFSFKLILDTLFFSGQILFYRPSASILFSIGSPSSVGGTEFQLNKLAEYLKEKEQKIIVLILGQVPLRKQNFFLNRLKKHGIFYLDMGNLGLTKNAWFQKYTSYLLKKLKGSTLQIFNPSCAPLIPSAKKAGLKVVYIETGLPSIDPWWNPLFGYSQWIDLTLGISKASLNQFRNLFGYRGVGEIFYSLIDSPPQNLELPCVTADKFHIVYFGRMHRQKGIELLLYAFQNLCKQIPHAQLTFIGDGPDKKSLQHQVIDRNLEKKIHFIDFQKKETLFKTLLNFDLFCLPSLSEGTPCSILEATSIGLPVLASRVGGIPEIIEDGISGILVAPNDLHALTKALVFLAQNPHLRSKLQSHSLKQYEKYYTNQKKQLSQLYFTENVCKFALKD